MRCSRFIKILFVTAIIIFSCVTAPAENKSDWPQALRFMSGPEGGNWDALGNILADVWTRAGLPKTAIIPGGGVSNILNINARRGDLGFSVTSLLGAALKGESDFKGRRIENAVNMKNLYPQYTYFIMRKDFAVKNKIKSVEDIIDKKPVIRFATLRPGTSSEFIVKALFEKAWNLDYKKVFQVQYESYGSGAGLLINNHIDCFAFSVGKIAQVIKNIENSTEIILLSVGDEALNKLSEAYGTAALEIEPGIYNSVTAPVKTVGDYTCIVCRKDLPEDLINGLKDAVLKNLDAIAEKVPDMLLIKDNK